VVQKAINASAADYKRGPLESWTEGALSFNGRDQYAVLTDKDINRTVDYRVRYVTQSGERVSEQRRVSGADLTDPQIHTSNLLIEAHFRTAPGQKDGTLIQKLDGAGYSLRVNEAGGVTVAAQADRSKEKR